ELERVLRLSGWGELLFLSEGQFLLPSGGARLLVPGAEIHVPLEGLLDLDDERARLRREIAAHEAQVQDLRAKLSNAEFVSKAPEDVVETHRERLADTGAAMERLGEALRDLEG